MARTKYNVRLLLAAETDQGYAHWDRKKDLPLLLSFIDRLNSLGWLPPNDARTEQLCTAFGAQPHQRGSSIFYEFCISGGRNERDPWLTVFFHFTRKTRTVRVLGIELTSSLAKHRTGVLLKIGARLDNLLSYLLDQGFLE